MPTGTNQTHQQDWGAVNVGSAYRPSSKGTKTGVEKRHGAGGNASAHSGGIMSARKLEEATDVGTIAKVDKSLSKAIMQARTAKKMTQKELATLINEKPQVVAEYESGKAVPNPQIISKIERKLGTKLPRPGKSKVAKNTTTGKKPGQSAAAARGLTRGGPAKRR